MNARPCGARDRATAVASALPLAPAPALALALAPALTPATDSFDIALVLAVHFVDFAP